MPHLSDSLFPIIGQLIPEKIGNKTEKRATFLRTLDEKKCCRSACSHEFFSVAKCCNKMKAQQNLFYTDPTDWSP
jgi:hypothetical protein